jgi:hypothetical protein
MQLLAGGNLCTLTHRTRVRSFVFLLACFVAVSGCQSDEARLKELQDHAALARLRVIYWEQQGNADSVAHFRRMALLAERDLQRFLGR